jgi:hypothetical protein
MQSSANADKYFSGGALIVGGAAIVYPTHLDNG